MQNQRFRHYDWLSTTFSRNGYMVRSLFFRNKFCFLFLLFIEYISTDERCNRIDYLPFSLVWHYVHSDLFSIFFLHKFNVFIHIYYCIIYYLRCGMQMRNIMLLNIMNSAYHASVRPLTMLKYNITCWRFFSPNLISLLFQYHAFYSIRFT